MRVVALAGGTGSSKLLRGLQTSLGQFTVIANAGDNVWMHGLYVCPDIDIAMYSLAGVSNQRKGWGVARDSFQVLRQMRKLGADAWFQLGDKDLATCLVRTKMLREGKTLTQATVSLCEGFGVEQRIIPPTDDPVETHIVTSEGEMHLQEFWVKNGGKPKVREVKYAGARRARVTREARDAVMRAESIILCPGNPVTSILPILAVGEFRQIMKRSRAKKSALSPMIGRGAYSGPAAKLMRAIGTEPTSLGVAKLYSDFLDEIIIHDADSEQAQPIRALGIECITANTGMRNRADEIRLATAVIQR